ncbi:MAG: hypothetical protein ACJAR2_001661, partial [Ilumatobacter sp.]
MGEMGEMGSRGEHPPAQTQRMLRSVAPVISNAASVASRIAAQ